MIRAGHDHAFDVLFERYHSRLLAFCRHMLRSTEDAEDVLQEVFVKAHGAMCADERPINVRPWLYRIARNRCLNHLRRPVPDGQDSMDVLVGEGGVTTADRVQKREDFRELVADVRDLPETQRTALLLREIDALSYDEIAITMDTTMPAVKSLLVRARMSLAEATHSRQLTCGEVRLELAEAAEGIRKATGPARHHVKRCEGCREYRGELRSNTKALAALAPIGPLALLYQTLIAKLGWGGSGSAAGSSAGGAGGTAVAGTGAAAGSGAAAAASGGAAAAGSGAAVAVGGSGTAFGGAAAAAGAGGLGGAFATKAAATAATAALLTTGAVEVRQLYSTDRVESPPAKQAQAHSPVPPKSGHGMVANYAPAPPAPNRELSIDSAATAPATAPLEPIPADEQTKEADPAPASPPIIDQISDGGVVGPSVAGDGDTDGATGSGTGHAAIVIAEPAAVTPTPEPAPTPPPPAEPAPAPTPDPMPDPPPAPPAP